MSLLDKLLTFTDGNKSKLAKELGVTRSLVSRWEDEGLVPEQYALQIEKLTDCEITANDVLIAAAEIRNPDWLELMEF